MVCCAVLWCRTGPGYRNVVGLPGGVKSPYFKLLQEANVNGMELREGQGNVYQVCTYARYSLLREGQGSLLREGQGNVYQVLTQAAA